MNKERLLNFLGIFLIFSSLFVIYFMAKENPVYIFWLSNHAPLIIGIAILTRNYLLLTAEIALIFVGELGWSLDFLSKLLFDFYLFGSTEYLFSPSYPTTLYWASMEHLIILPVGIVALFLLKKAENAWKLSLAHGLVVLFISFLFGSQYNLNCIYNSCISWLPTFNFYSIIWPIIYFIVFVLPANFILVKLIGTKRKKTR